MEKRPIIIDTDPGIDDAVALAIALFSEELDVKLITTVAGNVSLEKVTENTLRLLNFFEKEVPVAMGRTNHCSSHLPTPLIYMENQGWKGTIFRSRKKSCFCRNMR